MVRWGMAKRSFAVVRTCLKTREDGRGAGLPDGATPDAAPVSDPAAPVIIFFTFDKKNDLMPGN